MKKIVAEPYRDIDFSHAKRGAVIKPEPGKTKISIRLDNTILDYFRSAVDEAGGGNYQTLINDALFAYIQQQSVLEAVRQVVREELAQPKSGRSLARRSVGGRTSTALVR
ncbi:MAG: CopG family transcriptional regulator [Candidatus Methylomirabilota bacterium]|nr:MAG: CopG family transcriptional regulator [candidate division NC10 bacterium]